MIFFKDIPLVLLERSKVVAECEENSICTITKSRHTTKKKTVKMPFQTDNDDIIFVIPRKVLKNLSVTEKENNGK